MGTEANDEINSTENKQYQKIEIKSEEPEKIEEKEKIIHTNYICDGCEMNPIVGNRYKCTIRVDYDLCEDCEAKDTSNFPFIRIKNP